MDVIGASFTYTTFGLIKFIYSVIDLKTHTCAKPLVISGIVHENDFMLRQHYITTCLRKELIGVATKSDVEKLVFGRVLTDRIQHFDKNTISNCK